MAESNPDGSAGPQQRAPGVDVRNATLPEEAPVDDYEPRNHRMPKKPIKLWMAYFNLLRTLFGAGVLAMPLAISQAGIVLGPILAILTGLLVIHTHLMLLSCLNEISRQLKIPYISYRYGFRIALLHGPPFCQYIGKCGPNIITTFSMLSQIGICSVFVIFTSDSLRDMMDWETSKPALAVLLLPYLGLEYLMKTLKVITYISMFGNFLNLIGFGIVFYHIFRDPHGEVIPIATEALPCMFAFGIFLFVLSSINVILTLEKSLKEPKVLSRWNGILTIGIFIPAVVMATFGGLGYWSFGTMEENILRSLPFDDISAMAAIGLYLISVAFSYPIHCYSGVSTVLEVVENYHQTTVPSEATMKTAETFMRPLFVLITFLISYLIPFQGPFVAFVGNLCTALLTLVCPAMMEICLLYPHNYGKYNFYLVKNILIMVLGLTAFTFGVVLSSYLIYVRTKTKNPYDVNEYL